MSNYIYVYKTPMILCITGMGNSSAISAYFCLPYCRVTDQISKKNDNMTVQRDIWLGFSFSKVAFTLQKENSHLNLKFVDGKFAKFKFRVSFHF